MAASRLGGLYEIGNEVQDANGRNSWVPSMNDLFQGMQVSQYCDQAVALARAELLKLADEKILANTADELADYFVATLGLEPVEEDPTRAPSASQETRLRSMSSGRGIPTQVEIVLNRVQIPLVPRSTNAQALALGTRTSFMFGDWDALTFNADSQSLLLTTHPDNTATSLATIRQQLVRTNEEIAQMMPLLRPRFLRLATTRKDEVSARQAQFASQMTALGVEIEKKSDGVRPVNLDIKRTVQVLRAQSSSQPGDPYLKPEVVADIIEQIHQAGRSFEIAPLAYAKLGEEDLRSILLNGLNAVYGKTAATAETFSFKGRTDILLNPDGRGPLFVGECKIWGGQKLYSDTIDQLFRYVVWRDTAALLVTFSRNKGLSEVIKQGEVAIRAHPSFKGTITSTHETHRLSKHEHPRDAAKSIQLHHLFFDLATD